MISFAQAAEPSIPSVDRGVDWVGMIPLILIGGIFYFFLVRPQQKKEKQRQAMIAALARGDRVVTTGGLIGTVYRLSKDADLVLEFAEGVQITVRRDAIVEVLAKIPMEEEPEETEKRKAISSRVKKSTNKQK
ncbi:MAG: preprotein translocase subunit YajC [Holosporales bacterium]|jgi:preprotein translocase subunit YajC|nr:preprotein translocase subunit YajC [Holosporales bacterium]